MSRLQKKCFVGATGIHVFLLALLFVGPAFFVAEKVDDSPILEIIPDVTTDRDVKGGGNPNPQQSTPPPPQPTQPRTVDPQPPTPVPRTEQIEPRKVQKVQKSEPIKETRNEDAVAAKDKPQPHKVQVSDTVVKIRERKPATTTSSADKQAAAERSQRYANAVKALRAGLSQTTSIETPTGGFGGGGPSYANYTQVVRKIYNDAWNAWSVPDDVTDDEATVQVRVTIARNGRVVKSEILRSSGSRAVINAAQAVLDRVTFVKEFPADSKDTERTFTMTFKLNARNTIG